MAFQSTQYLVETCLNTGGGTDRLETGPRVRNLTSDEIFNTTFNLPAGAATIVTLYSYAATGQHMLTLTGLTIVLDPGTADGAGTYDDNSTDPVIVNVEITIADTAGANTSLIRARMRRERVLSIPGEWGALITSTTADRVIYLVRAQNMHATSAIKARLRLTD